MNEYRKELLRRREQRRQREERAEAAAESVRGRRRTAIVAAAVAVTVLVAAIAIPMRFHAVADSADDPAKKYLADNADPDALSATNIVDAAIVVKSPEPEGWATGDALMLRAPGISFVADVYRVDAAAARKAGIDVPDGIGDPDDLPEGTCEKSSEEIELFETVGIEGGNYTGLLNVGAPGGRSTFLRAEVLVDGQPAGLSDGIAYDEGCGIVYVEKAVAAEKAPAMGAKVILLVDGDDAGQAPEGEEPAESAEAIVAESPESPDSPSPEAPEPEIPSAFVPDAANGTDSAGDADADDEGPAVPADAPAGDGAADGSLSPVAPDDGSATSPDSTAAEEIEVIEPVIAIHVPKRIQLNANTSTGLDVSLASSIRAPKDPSKPYRVVARKPTVSFASDNEAVAVVSPEGTVTAKAAGTANVTATVIDALTGDVLATGTTVVEVTVPSRPPVFMALSQQTALPDGYEGETIPVMAIAGKGHIDVRTGIAPADVWLERIPLSDAGNEQATAYAASVYDQMAEYGGRLVAEIPEDEDIYIVWARMQAPGMVPVHVIVTEAGEYEAFDGTIVLMAHQSVPTIMFRDPASDSDKAHASVTLKEGESARLDPHLVSHEKHVDGQILCESEDGGIATVADDFTVTGVKAGTTLVRVTSAATTWHAAASVTVPVTVKAQPQPVRADYYPGGYAEFETDTASRLSDGSGGPGDLPGAYKDIVRLPTDCGKVTILASCDYRYDKGTGAISAICPRPGQYAMTVRVAKSDRYAAMSRTWRIQMRKSVPTVRTTNAVTVKSGNTQRLAVTVQDRRGRRLMGQGSAHGGLVVDKISYSSSNTRVATVDDNGVVRGITPGTATVAVRTGATAWYLPGTATVRVTVPKLPPSIMNYYGGLDAPTARIEAVPNCDTSYFGFGRQTASQMYEPYAVLPGGTEATGQVTATSSNNSIIELRVLAGSNRILALPKRVGTARVTIRTTGGTRYAATTASHTVTVTRPYGVLGSLYDNCRANMASAEPMLLPDGSVSPGQANVLAYWEDLSGKGRTQAAGCPGATTRYAGAIGTGGGISTIDLALRPNPHRWVPLETSLHYRTRGWEGTGSHLTGEISQGAANGSKREGVDAIRIKLPAAWAARYDIWYRVECQGYGWMGWAKNGQPAGTAGRGMCMEAIQVTLTKKGEQAPSASLWGVGQQQPQAFVGNA